MPGASAPKISIHLIRFRILSFLRYFFSAKNAHGIHSPFIYELYTRVIRGKGRFYALEKLQAYRSKLSTDSTVLQLVDLGAGSALHPILQQVSVRSLYKTSCHPYKDTALLFRLVHHFKPRQILELGTCLGLTTLYLAKADSRAKVHTLEGNPDYARYARWAFEAHQAANITLVEGNIHQTLPRLIEQLPVLDFAFLDAHHAYEPTLSFFRTCLRKTHEHSVIVLDDIHWSPDMQRAWEAIKTMKEVQQTVDLYQFGLVFFRPVQAREHFVLRYF